MAFRTLGTDLTSNDSNTFLDIYLHDRSTGSIELISSTPAGVAGNGPSQSPDISADGRLVAFESFASDLTVDPSVTWDIFVRDWQSQQTQCVSQPMSGQASDGMSTSPRISADGRFVVFQSRATTLVPGDTNDRSDIFVRELATGSLYLASISSAGVQVSDDALNPSISWDGRFVSFDSNAGNLVAGDTNGSDDVFVHDRQNRTTVCASLTYYGASASGGSHRSTISADGRFVAFDSNAGNLVPHDTNWNRDVFVRDLQQGNTVRASVTSSGLESNGISMRAEMAADGGSVVFISYATNLVPADFNKKLDVFVHELATGQTTRVSAPPVGPEANGDSGWPRINADGNVVVFDSGASNLVAFDANGVGDVFVREFASCSPTVAAYYTPGTSSAGCTAWLSANGMPSGSAGSNFTLTVQVADGARNGMLFYGLSGPLPAPFMSSFGGVHAPVQRTILQATGGTPGMCDGQFALDWNAYIAQHGTALGVPFTGMETVWAQAWIRDPAVPLGATFTNGVWFQVCP